MNFYKSGKLSGVPFDVITLFHVLEHLPTPKVLLENLIRDNLKDGGLLVLEVPNLNSLQAIIAGKNWLHLDIPRHLNHFTKRRLVSMLNNLNNVNVNILKIEYFSSVLGLQGMINSIFNLFGYRKSLISELKYNRKPILILGILVVLPLAFFLELFSSIVNKGAVIRIYAIKKGI